MVNYTANLRRLGFTDDDLAGRGSDRLVDAVIAHGTAEQVAARLDEHLGPAPTTSRCRCSATTCWPATGR